MSFDHRSTRSNPSLLPSLDDPESKLRNPMQTHESSFQTARDVNDDKMATSAWATLLNDDDVIDDGNDGTRPKMEEMETRVTKDGKAPTIAESKPQTDNVVPSHGEIETMIAAQVKRATKQIVAKEITTLVEESLDDILQCAYENARSGVRSVVYNVVEQVVFDLIRQDVIGETLDKHISAYLDTENAADKVCDKLLSNNSFMTPIATFVKRKTNETIAAERVVAKMKEHLHITAPDPAVKHIERKSVSPPSRTESALSSPSSDNQQEHKSNHRRSKRRSRSRRRHRRHSKDEKRSSTSDKSAKPGESSSDSESDTDHEHQQRRHTRRLSPPRSGSDSDSSRGRRRKDRRSKEDLPKTIRPVNNRFRDALDFRTYRLVDTSPKYDDRVAKRVAKWAKRLQVQMKTNIFDSFDPISIISFLSAFKLACDTNGVHEGAAMWLLHFFMKKPAAAALNSRISLPSKSHRRHKEGTLTTYCEVVNYLLETYATDDVIAETDAEILRFTQPPTKSPTEYAEALWNKALRCDRVYDEYVLKGIFIEGLHESIRHSMRSYWGSRKNATVHDLARHATSLTNLQHGSRIPDVPRNMDRPNNRRGNMHDRKNPRQTPPVAHVNSDSTTTLATPQSSDTVQPVMAVQLPNSQSGSPSPSSSTTSADNAPFCRLCLSTAHLTSRCPLVPEQIRTLLVNQRTANLPGLPPRRPYPYQPYRPPQRSPSSPKKGNRNQPPSSPTTQQSVTAAVTTSAPPPSTPTSQPSSKN